MGSLMKRVLVQSESPIPEVSRGSSGFLSNLGIEVIATNADLALTVAQISKGIVQFSSFSAGRAVTTPTAAAMLAAAANMDIGDSFSFFVSAQAAFAATWVAGTGVTLKGRATTPASSWSLVTVTKTAAATVDWNVS